eukprot:GDKJ01028937.1.p1 GENE.GDKJ01028937.1~~GDKJ01028937.1.p1  ORF type:complete len:1889 (-),score=359.64 GDKJ01028937.1:113-5779(-)
MQLGLNSLQNDRPKTFLLNCSYAQDHLKYRIFLKMVLSIYGRDSDTFIFSGDSPTVVSRSEAIESITSVKEYHSCENLTTSFLLGAKNSQLVILTNAVFETKSISRSVVTPFSEFDLIAWQSPKTSIPRWLARLSTCIPSRYYLAYMTPDKTRLELAVRLCGQITDLDLKTFAPSAITLESINLPQFVVQMRRFHVYAKLLRSTGDSSALQRLLNRIRYLRQLVQINAVNEHSALMTSKLESILSKVGEKNADGSRKSKKECMDLLIPFMKEMLSWEGGCRAECVELFRSAMSFVSESLDVLSREPLPECTSFEQLLEILPYGQVLGDADVTDLITNDASNDAIQKLMDSIKKESMAQEVEKDGFVDCSSPDFLDFTNINSYKPSKKSTDGQTVPLVSTLPSIKELLSLPLDTPVLCFSSTNSLTHLNPNNQLYSSASLKSLSSPEDYNFFLNLFGHKNNYPKSIPLPLTFYKACLGESPDSFYLPLSQFVASHKLKISENFASLIEQSFGHFNKILSENRVSILDFLTKSPLEYEADDLTMNFLPSPLEYWLKSLEEFKEDSKELSVPDAHIEAVKALLDFELAPDCDLLSRDKKTVFQCTLDCDRLKSMYPSAIYRVVHPIEREFLTNCPLNAVTDLKRVGQCLASHIDSVITVRDLLKERLQLAHEDDTWDRPSCLRISKVTGRVLSHALVLHEKMDVRNETLMRNILRGDELTDVDVGDLRFWWLNICFMINNKWNGTQWVNPDYEKIANYTRNLFYRTSHSASLSGLSNALMTRLPFAAGLFLCANYNHLVNTEKDAAATNKKSKIDLPIAPQGILNPIDLYLTCLRPLRWGSTYLLGFPSLASSRNEGNSTSTTVRLIKKDDTALKKAVARVVKMKETYPVRVLQLMMMAAAGKISLKLVEHLPLKVHSGDSHPWLPIFDSVPELSTFFSASIDVSDCTATDEDDDYEMIGKEPNGTSSSSSSILSSFTASSSLLINDVVVPRFLPTHSITREGNDSSQWYLYLVNLLESFFQHKYQTDYSIISHLRGAISEKLNPNICKWLQNLAHAAGALSAEITQEVKNSKPVNQMITPLTFGDFEIYFDTNRVKIHEKLVNFYHDRVEKYTSIATRVLCVSPEVQKRSFSALREEGLTRWKDCFYHPSVFSTQQQSSPIASAVLERRQDLRKVVSRVSFDRLEHEPEGSSTISLLHYSNNNCSQFNSSISLTQGWSMNPFYFVNNFKSVLIPCPLSNHPQLRRKEINFFRSFFAPIFEVCDFESGLFFEAMALVDWKTKPYSQNSVNLEEEGLLDRMRNAVDENLLRILTSRNQHHANRVYNDSTFQGIRREKVVVLNDSVHSESDQQKMIDTFSTRVAHRHYKDTMSNLLDNFATRIIDGSSTSTCPTAVSSDQKMAEFVLSQGITELSHEDCSSLGLLEVHASYLDTPTINAFTDAMEEGLLGVYRLQSASIIRNEEEDHQSINNDSSVIYIPMFPTRVNDVISKTFASLIKLNVLICFGVSSSINPIKFVTHQYGRFKKMTPEQIENKLKDVVLERALKSSNIQQKANQGRREALVEYYSSRKIDSGWFTFSFRCPRDQDFERELLIPVVVSDVAVDLRVGQNEGLELLDRFFYQQTMTDKAATLVKINKKALQNDLLHISLYNTHMMTQLPRLNTLYVAQVLDTRLQYFDWEKIEKNIADLKLKGKKLNFTDNYYAVVCENKPLNMPLLQNIPILYELHLGGHEVSPIRSFNFMNDVSRILDFKWRLMDNHALMKRILSLQFLGDILKITARNSPNPGNVLNRINDHLMEFKVDLEKNNQLRKGKNASRHEVKEQRNHVLGETKYSGRDIFDMKNNAEHQLIANVVAESRKLRENTCLQKVYDECSSALIKAKEVRTAITHLHG